MSRVWQLQEAKARFSELFNQACSDGPQRVSRHGKQTVVVLSEEAYLALSQSTVSLVDYLLAAPKADLDIRRAADYGRVVEL